MRTAITIAAAIAASGLALACLKWAFLPWLPYRRLPRHRVRYLRLRVHLRLHPGPGHATLPELWLRWGRLACFRGSRQARHALPLRQRLSAASEYSVLIGRAHYRHALRLPLLVTSDIRTC